MGVDFGGAGPLYALTRHHRQRLQLRLARRRLPRDPAGLRPVRLLCRGRRRRRRCRPARGRGELIGHATGGGDGIEIGWADGTAGGTMAMRHGQQSPVGDPGSRSTAYGASMNALLVSLGAPSGQLQGPVYGSAPGVATAARTGSSAAGAHRAAAPTAGAATAGQGFYVVRPGDTLSGIARQVCGAAQDWVALWQANPFITDPDLIYPGAG